VKQSYKEDTMRWSLYGVFANGKWGMTTNKKNAMVEAKKHKGEVRQMPYPKDTYSWDAPTFRVCSDQIADFREVEK
jgi:hypothetical protein